MGKGEQHHPQPPLPPISITHPPQSPPPNCSPCCCLFLFKCLFVLLLGLSVLLSAVFWLPPFFHHQDLDLDYSPYKGHDIVATFMIQMPLSLLQDDFPRLEGDIFDEIRVPTTKVVILTAERNKTCFATFVGMWRCGVEFEGLSLSSYCSNTKEC